MKFVTAVTETTSTDICEIGVPAITCLKEEGDKVIYQHNIIQSF